MSDTSLIFNLLAIDRVSSVLGGINGSFGKFALGAGLAAADAGAHFVHMAGDFQAAMTRVETGAGEAHSAIAADSAGILDEMGKVGLGAQELSKGLYNVNSAGYHGAQGLSVLDVAAKGAKVGAADLYTTTDALTTALNAWHMGAGGATAAMNTLVAAEGQGKTTLEALASALPTVATAAATVGIKFDEVAAALSTMTGQGTSADVAATYLRQTIAALSAPSVKAQKEMEALGLRATDVGLSLGKNGLASTLGMLTDAIQRKMGPAGLVVIETLRKASGTAGEFEKALGTLPPKQQTYIGALATMVGGTKSMQAALQLTGANMGTFKANIAAIDEKVKAGGSSVEGWSTVQQTFNQRLAEAKGTSEALGIKIGNFLLPHVQQTLTATMNLVGWFSRHKDVAAALAITIGTVTAAFTAYKVVMMAIAAWKVIDKIGKATKAWTAAQWLLNAAMDANPIGLIVIAIVAVIGGIYLLWTHCAAFRNFWIGTWHVIVEAAQLWWRTFSGFWKTIGSFLVDLVTGWWHLFTGFWTAIGSAIIAAWNGVVTEFNAVVGFFKALPGRILAGIMALPGLLKAALVKTLEDIAYAVGFYIGFMVGFWVRLPGRIISAVSSLGRLLWGWITAAWTWVSTATVAGITAIVGFWMKLPGRIISAVSSLGHLLWGWITTAWNWVTATYTAAVNATVAWFKALPGRIVAAVARLATDLWQWMTDTWNRVTGAVSHGVDTALAFFSALPGRIWGLVSGIPGQLEGLGGDIIHGLIRGIENMAGKLWGLAKDLASHFVKGFKDAFEINSPSKLIWRLTESGIGGGFMGAMAALRQPVRRSSAAMAGAAAEGIATAVAAPVGLRGASTTAGAPASGEPATVRLVVDDTEVGRLLMAVLRKAIRQTTGGNVQLALGRG